MKHNFVITGILTLAIGASALAPSKVFAQGNEGVSSVINSTELEAVKSWIENTKQDLGRAVDTAKHADVARQESILRRAIESVLSKGTKPSEEFLTRNILYRAQEVHNMLLGVTRGPKRDAFARWFLFTSVEQAIQLAPIDIACLGNQAEAELGAQKRLVLGFNWAQQMLASSFSLPTNKSHFEFLNKIMGFLYNDILQDDAFNRRLAGVAAHFADMSSDQSHIPLNSPLDYLAATKNLRDFLSQEIKIAAQTIGTLADKTGKFALPRPNRVSKADEINPEPLVVITNKFEGLQKIQEVEFVAAEAKLELELVVSYAEKGDIDFGTGINLMILLRKVETGGDDARASFALIMESAKNPQMNPMVSGILMNHCLKRTGNDKTKEAHVLFSKIAQWGPKLGQEAAARSLFSIIDWENGHADAISGFDVIASVSDSTTIERITSEYVAILKRVTNDKTADAIALIQSVYK